MRSIFEQLLPLGDDTRVLPGHMELTTIGRERQTNPFLLDYAQQQAEKQ
jgi:hydroxyacylglutathione hydrolase